MPGSVKDQNSIPKTCTELFPAQPEAQIACELGRTAIETALAAAGTKAASRVLSRVKAPAKLKKLLREEKIKQDFRDTLDLLKRNVFPLLPFFSPLPGFPMLLPTTVIRSPMGGFKDSVAEQMNGQVETLKDIARAQIRVQAEILDATLPFFAPPASLLNQMPRLVGEEPLTQQLARGLEDFLGL